MNRNILESLAVFLKANNDYAIVCHENPDGDALGSLFALMFGLKGLNKRVQAVCVDAVPYKYSRIAGIAALRKPDELEPFSHLICVDCADIHRTGLSDEVLKSVQTFVNIDHHSSNEGFGQYHLLSTDAAATGILIYELLNAMGVSIEPHIAQNLLIAISADTGHFSHANTNAQALYVASELVAHGAQANTVAREMFQVTTLGRVKLLGRAIQSLELHCNGKAALMCLSLQDFEDSKATMADVEGIIDMARNIESVQVSALIRQTDEEHVKVSLRSTDDVDVSLIAAEYSGGGHMRAAGFSIDMSLCDAKKLLITMLEKLKCKA